MNRLPGARLNVAFRLLAALAAIGMLTGSLVVSCAGDPSSGTNGGGASAPSSQAMGRWAPATQDTCTQALHDTYFVIGPDGKKYPTWHAPEVMDPDTNRTCSFGHDHGFDPRGSALWPDIQRHFAHDANQNGLIDADELAVSGIAFGLVSEQLASSATPRLEDHTGYKVIWQDNVARSLASGGGTEPFSLTCNLFAAYNQATSTADAFASNMFSVTYAVDCNNGASRAQYPAKVIVSVMAVYGAPGSFTIDVNGVPTPQDGGTPVPINSPAGGTELGRQIPARDGVFAQAFVASGQVSNFDAALSERWETLLRLRRVSGTEIATLAPAFSVFNPARYWDGGLARSIDLCYFGLDASGNLVTDPLQAASIVRQARGAPCAAIAPNGPATPLASRLEFDDPASPFNACHRSAGFGADVVRNIAGPSIWYTDAFGGNGSTVPFANSVKQFVAGVDTGSIVLTEASVVQPFCQSSLVHAPN